MLSRKKILIVEDNPLNLKLIKDIIDSIGYQAIPLNCGKDVIINARKHNPDLILLDLHLPDVHGFSLLEMLRDNNLQDIPVIAISALAKLEDKSRAKELGCIDYLVKPISIDKFIERLNVFFTRQEEHVA